MVNLESYREQLLPAVESKLSEFALLGYDKVKESDFWKYLVTKKWKKLKEEDIQLHKLVNDILTVKVNEYMTFATVEAFQSPSWFSTEGANDLKELLK